ncbi:MAG: efflux RND transporter periplasmic adaptor subunit [Planctomycetaceae bacterium]|jgi:membrane fusion protein (multidrug efflux system)|nr:efflux RND transporter periplasmic adaptor subunit [Planctomycetaceae bacterium]
MNTSTVSFTMNYLFRIHFLIVLSLLFAASCHFQMPQPPVPNVCMEEVLVRDVPQYFYTTGETVASQTIQIPARVTGILEKRLYEKGEIVGEGKPLFLIEQAPHLIAMQSAQAKLNANKAKLALAESTLEKTRQLRAQNASTDQDLQTDISTRDQAVAIVQDSEAALAQAELNLKYTQINSPITGKTNLADIAVGNLVGPGTSNTVLTTIVALDPMAVVFSISDSNFHTLLEEYLKTKETQTEPPKPVEIEMGFFKNSTPYAGNYPFKGQIYALDNVINSSTGTFRIIGKIPNPRYEMLPGEICRIRILRRIHKNAVIIRQEAIGIDLNQHYVFVVDDKNIAHRRNVELGDIQPDNTRIVLKGLQQGEQYVVRGIQNVRDDAKVNIVSNDKEPKNENNENKNNENENNENENNKNNENENNENNTEKK